jgi:hypothetical protein
MAAIARSLAPPLKSSPTVMIVVTMGVPPGWLSTWVSNMDVVAEQIRQRWYRAHTISLRILTGRFLTPSPPFSLYLGEMFPYSFFIACKDLDRIEPVPGS